MTKPSNFIVHSGYASLKNDANSTVSLTIPSGRTIAPFSSATFSTSITLGTMGASTRARIRKNSGPWYPGNGLAFLYSFVYVGIPMPVTQDYTQANIERTGPNTVRLYVVIPNPTDLTVEIRATATISANISTFLSPFV